ncbi:MAG TPA: SpvB/TcaC N-terminal domain-containing protein [Thermomicrobiaceae bacterium]|nr:SpvB/TcaC N-terminal domain-containing protein [Thermomicrobiaceae bacterium]
MRRRRGALLAVIAIFTMVVAPLAAQAQGSSATGQIASLLGLPAQGSPLTTDPNALQQNLAADPGANISQIAPPDPNSQGAARLAYPIEVPPGRAGTQPDLSISYDSSNADGWLGLGWDLSTPAIAVDTRWGVPRYDANKESESYDFNGNELTPLAHTGQLQDRQSSPDGVTFHLRVEGSFYKIQRYGDNPTNYFWVVTDQSAAQHLYGATLQQTSNGLVPVLDKSQVLADANGNIYKWPLLEVADFNSNLTTYTYARVNDPISPADPNSPDGTQLYLANINYDGENDGSTTAPGPYNVSFSLTQSLSNGTPRPDVLTDARGGFLMVTARLLSKITVSYNNQTIRSYDLSYIQGEFNKTLLQSVTQNGADGSGLATHSFSYYDNVHESDGSYNGFSPSAPWNTGSDSVDSMTLQDASGLSGAVANSYDGHIYLGFNPVDPTKEGSVGVSVNYNHIDSNDTLAMIDINGDGLPDKVFESDGTIYYRLNQSAPGSTSSTTFGTAEPVTGLDTLGQQSSDTVAVGPEAYVGVSVLYNHAWTFNNSPIYFIDVNNDGLPDLVQNGHVLFDHLVDGAPTFNFDSSTTQVPLGTSQVDAAPLLPGLQSAYQQELAASPLVDTVRRWVAPFAGTISIGGSVNLIQDTSAARQNYTTADGVTVAIQHNGDQLWSQTIGATDSSSYTPSGVGSITVQAGDRIYFRVESGFDGKYDQVNWDPSVTYTGVTAVTDADGLNVYSFDATKDFTLAGRQHITVTMPFDGTISITGALHKAGVTSDDVTLQVLQNGSAVFSQTVAWNKTGTITPPSSLNVKKGDTIELHVKLDSRVDLSQISWDPSLFYTAATDANGNAVTVTDASGNYDIQLNPPYSMDIYPRSTIAQPDTGQTLSATGSATVTPSLTGIFTPNSPSGQISFTVKTTKQLLGKETLKITSGQVTACTIEAPDGSTTDCGTSGWQAFSVGLPQSGPVFFAFSVTDPVLSDNITAGSVVVTQGSTSNTYQAPVQGLYNPSNTMDKGLFAQPYRGWAVAGYNGGSTSDGTALDESKLVYKQSDYPTPSNYYNPNLGIDPHTGYPTQNYDPNTGFTGAAGSANPVDASAWALTPSPAHLDTLTNPPAPVPDQWLGPKDEIWARAGSMSSSRLTQDYVSVPTASSFQGAGAVNQMSETQQDAIQGSFLGLGGSYSWGASDGNLDELDMNGDGFPDIVGSNSIQYTNTVGSLDSTATGEPALNASVRESHSIAWNIGFEGSPAKFTADAKGDTNAPEQADPNSGTTRSASSSQSGTSETASASEPALTTGESTALTTRPGGSGNNGSAAAESQSQVATTSSTASGRSTRGGSATGSEPDGDPPQTASDGGQELNLGVSGQYAQGETNQNGDHAVGGTLVNTDLIDINGDGLPDKVSTYSDGHMEVAFNLGYTFTAPVTWSNNAVTQRGTSQSFTVGGSIGFSDGMYGFGGGVSGGQETDHDNGVLVDMNGDGLADYVTNSNGNLMVAINTGDGFAPPVVWHGADANIATSKSTNLGGGAYFTIGIGPLCFPTDLCYIIVNPGFDYSQTQSSQQLQLRDINGDGFPDDLSSSSNSSISVAQNNTGDTNLLESVSRPLGASFTIEYTRAGNTTAAPASVWTMSRVTVNDNTPSTSANTQVTTYSYANNFYDREERQVYGYATVTSNEIDPSTNAVYRTIVDSYANDNYYDQGLLTSEKVENGSGAIYTQTDNSYALLDETTNQTVTNGQAESLTLDEIFPQLSQATQSYSWGQATPGKTETVTYQYDALGNTTLISDSGDGPSNAVTAATQFVSCPNVNLFNVPTSVIVTDANGTVLRHQEATVPCSEGAPTQIRQYLAGGSFAQTDITYYDATGQHYNIKSVTSPPNLNGQRYAVNYTYDPTDTYVAQTTDSFGYVSTATYDPLYGMIASSTDINGNTTSYSYDAFGRLASVTGPYQQGTGTATVTYEYHPGDPVPWAETHAIDTLHGGTLDTATFVDGLDRTVETKHDATVFTGAGSQPVEVMVVSGRVTFDFLGRVIAQYYPTTEPLGTPAAFNSTYDSQPPATSSYDVLDRLTQYVAPNGSTTGYAYGFGADRSGATQFMTTETDALGNQTATFTNVRQQVTAIDMFNGSQPIWTSYDYSPLNQLTAMTDDQGHVTTMAYDDIGRETSITSPNSGLTTMRYDPASNLISKVTADLAQEGHGKAIQYNYDFTHLTGISYPDFTGNNVRYTYGGPGAANNAAGQIVTAVDQAGRQAYAYGKIGETTSEADTINPIQGQPLATYTTAYSYDTWDRLASLTYPDGEVVTYGYGFGGLVNQVAGVKGSNSYTYASSLQYDKFGHQVFQRDGNGVQTVSSYTPNSQRLQNIQTGNSAGLFQNQSYSYDAVGNVTSKNNDVPVPAASQYGGPSAQSFTYDHLYRLTGASGTYQYAPGNTRNYTLALTYDSLGNILTNTQTDTITVPGSATLTQAATTRSWTYAYTGTQPNAVSHVAGAGTLGGQSNGKGSGNSPESGVTFSYDANGNETGWTDDASSQRRAIVWDEENRVQSINNSGQKTSYRYDDQGNRIVTAGPGGVTTNVNPYYTVVNGANAVKNVFAGTQRIAQQAVTTDGSYESGQYYYHQDLTGSTAYVTDVGGSVFQHLEYFPTGETWVDEVSDPHVIPYLYTSHPFDEVTQLYYYGARYGDPRLDQFISPDPTLQSDPQTAIDDPMALNPYTYVDNNPVRYVDNNGKALTSAQEQFLRQAFANPETRAAFLQASNKIIKAYLSQQPAIVKLAASLPDKETLIAGYKKLATLSLPPLVEIGFKTNSIQVKIVGIKVPKPTARH